MPARDYEILYIVKPDLDEEAVAAASKSVEDLISGFGGTVQKTDQWGRRKLAYEVQHLREGYYVLTDFQFDTDRVPDLEGQLRISETVFRYLVTRKPDRIRSTRARRKAARAAAEAASAAAEAVSEAAEPESAAAEPESAGAEAISAAVEPESAAAEAVSEAAEPESETADVPSENVESGPAVAESEPVGAAEVE